MFKYAIWLSLACATLFHAAEALPSADGRRARSFWPFSSSEAETEPLISEEHRELLEEAGLGKTFNLSSHPLWKVHKYHGIDLKPVQIQTEIIKSVEQDAQNVPSTLSVTPASEASVNATTEPLDLSFLDDLGGLAWLLPEPREDENLESMDEATDLIADAIKKEDESNPGFLKQLWWKLWGPPNPTSQTNATSEAPAATPSSGSGLFSSIFGYGQTERPETKPDKETLTIYLPETQGNYAAVVVPSPFASGQVPNQFFPAELIKSQAVQRSVLSTQDEPVQGFRETETTVPSLIEPFPANHAKQYSELVVEQVPAPQKPMEVRPVARQPVPSAAGSQAWIQSWSPYASYSVHVQGAETVSPVAIAPVPQPLDEAQRKISQDEEPAAVEPEAQVQVDPLREKAPTSSTEASLEAAVRDIQKGGVERARDILSKFNLPEGLMKKLQVNQQDVDALLNDKESQARAAERLRTLQREFDMRREQLSYAYPTIRKQK